METRKFTFGFEYGLGLDIQEQIEHDLKLNSGSYHPDPKLKLLVRSVVGIMASLAQQIHDLQDRLDRLEGKE